MAPPFKDRHDAGRQLAALLQRYVGRRDVLELGLARGGVTVASEVALALDAPLDILVVRKLGVPEHEEVPLGAITSGGVRVLDSQLIRRLHIPDEVVSRVTSEQHRELDRRECAFRETRPTPDVHGKTVILVDDGLPVGAGMFPAVAALRQQAPAAIVAAVPVAAPEAATAMRAVADGFVCLAAPRRFEGVAGSYVDFDRTTDAEVRALLEADARRRGVNGRPRPSAPHREPLAAPPG